MTINQTLYEGDKKIPLANLILGTSIIFADIIVLMAIIYFPIYIVPISNLKNISFDIILISVFTLIILYSIPMLRNLFKQNQYRIFSYGFIYPYKLRGARGTDNLLFFDDIAEIAFSWFGLFFYYRLKDGNVGKISSDEGLLPYKILIHLIIMRVPINKLPNIKVIDEFIDASLKGEDDRSHMQQIIHENKEFQNLPTGWLNDKTSR
jgi:hypothetical protein